MATTVDASGLRRAVVSRGGFIAQRAAIDIRKEQVQAAKPHYQSGEMERKTRVTHQRLSPTVWRITAENPTVQAAVLEHGSGIYGRTGARITPRRASVLRFVVDGRVVFARSVKGVKATHWFSRVFNPTSIRGILSRFVGR